MDAADGGKQIDAVDGGKQIDAADAMALSSTAAGIEQEKGDATGGRRLEMSKFEVTFQMRDGKCKVRPIPVNA